MVGSILSHAIVALHPKQDSIGLPNSNILQDYFLQSLK